MESKYVAKSMERQHLKAVRKHSLQIVDINLALKDLHHQIAPHIDETKYEAITSYVNQYISHTHIWNLKFACNLEDPEVALMQLFHLKYILEHEDITSHTTARTTLEQQRLKFRNITLYSDAHIQMRQEKMRHYVQQYETKKGER